MPIRSLAVLPFLPLEGSERDDALSVGMAASVITRLTKVGQLVVRPTSAVVNYVATGRDAASLGREQAVDAVVDGQIQRDGDRVRVTVQLIRTRDGRPIWADKFDEKLQDVFAIQDAIAEKVVSGLQVTLTREGWRQLEIRDTNNVVAYQAWLNGSYHLTTFAPGAFEKAVGYLNEAIRLEPGYGRAHAGLALAYAERAFIQPNRAELAALARKHAEIARGIDETMPELHIALVNIRQYHDWDWAETEAECQRLIALAPGDARSYQMHGWALSLLGRFDERSGRSRRGMSNLTCHRIRGARQPSTASVTLARRLRAGLARRRGEVDRDAEIHGDEHVCPRVPNRDGLRGLGDTRQAMDWLERAYRERSVWMAWLRVEPSFDKMRNDSRFVGLIKKLKY